MNQPPPQPRDQRKIDADHLRLLSIFHFVGAGLAFLAIFFLLAHFAIFHTVFSNPQMWENQKQSAPPAEFFALFKWFYLLFAIWFVGSCVLNLLSGLFIRSRKHRTFSLIVSAINCLYIPLGTALGVFTIVLLMRDSVRQLYETSPLPAT